MNLISCKVAKAQGLKRYYTGKPCKHGHIAERHVTGGCVVCANLDQQRYYAEDPDKYKSKTVEYREGNRELTNRVQRDYYARHAPKLRAESARHRASRMLRVPAWSETEQIKTLYAACPPGHEVDHIIPLQGETVSGLHVFSNLQYLTVAENRSKNNKVCS